MNDARSLPAARRFGQEAERPLSPGEEPPLGSHVVTPRGAYAHHGIYVGGGRVVHYRAIWRGLRGGRVEETVLERFARRRLIYVRAGVPSFDAPTIVERAYSRLGEHRYSVLSNNCEHLCEWCLRGRSRSAQVEAVRALPRTLLGRLAARITLLVVATLAPCRPKRLTPRTA